MRKLYEIDESVVYYVVANDRDDAIMQARNCELESGNTETEILSEATVTEMTRETASKRKFFFDGEDESCSMWLAYMIVRDHASTVLACSEWG